MKTKLVGICIFIGITTTYAAQSDNTVLQTRALIPIVEERQLTPQELAIAKKYQQQIDDFIAKSRQTKTFDIPHLSKILKSAQKESLPDQVLHQYVMDLVKAFPERAGHIVHTAAMSYGKRLHPEHVMALAQTATISHPTPYKSIPMIIEQVKYLNQCANLGINPDDLAVDLAQIAPDNPLSPVAVTNLPNSNNRDPNTATPRAARNTPASVFTEMFFSRVPLSNPTVVTPVSAPGGEVPVTNNDNIVENKFAN